MGGEEERNDEPATPPPGEGESLEDASRDALREIKRRDGEGHAGTGDIG